MRLSLGSLLLAASLGMAVPAQADIPLLWDFATGDSTYLFEDFDLDDRDRTLAMDSQATLLGNAGAVPGNQVDWSNAQSGNAGSVVFIQAFEYQGLPCRGLEHRVKHKGSADTASLRTAGCQTADGGWKTL